MVSFNTAQATANLRQVADSFKMNELGDERKITIGPGNQIVKAGIMEAPSRAQTQSKPRNANTGLFDRIFKATIDKNVKWHSAGKLRRAQDAMEANLGRVAGKFVNLQALAGKDGLSLAIRNEKELLSRGIAQELSAFKGEIRSLHAAYGLQEGPLETLFLQRLVNSLKNTDALTHLKAAVEVIDSMSTDPLMREHGELIDKLYDLLKSELPHVTGEHQDQRTGLQKLGDVFKELFGTKEERLGVLVKSKQNALDELCKIGGAEMDEFRDRIRSLRDDLGSVTNPTIDDYEKVQKALDSIIGETIKRGRDLAQTALEKETAIQPGQLQIDKYHPQLLSAKEANRALSKLFIHKNATQEGLKSLQTPQDQQSAEYLRTDDRSKSQSQEEHKGAVRVIVEGAVSSVRDMTHKLIAVQHELKGLEADFSAIALAKQLVAKRDSPPENVSPKAWSEACSVMTDYLRGDPKSRISEKDVAALNLIKTHADHFKAGLEDVALQRFEKLFTRLDATTPFIVGVPKPTTEQIEQFKQTGKISMQENAAQFNKHLRSLQDSAPKTGIPELDTRAHKLRTEITRHPLDVDKLDEGTLRNTRELLGQQLDMIKMAYSYEMASVLSGFGRKEARQDKNAELFAALKIELQGLMRLDAELEGMINIHAMNQLATEELDQLRQACPEKVDLGEWESDCNTIAGLLLEHPSGKPDEKTVALFDRLLDKLNTASLASSNADPQKVELYDNLKNNLSFWSGWGFGAGEGRDSLNDTKHITEVREQVSKMTTARIRVSDMANLIGESLIASRNAGLFYPAELHSNLTEYTSKLIAYAETNHRNMFSPDLPSLREEVQESLSKTIHSFFPAMQLLAEQEHSYLADNKAFSVESMQKLTDLRTTMFNAYAALSDITSNVEYLGLGNANDISPLFDYINQTEKDVRFHDQEAKSETSKMNAFAERSKVVSENNPLASVTLSMLKETEARIESRIHSNSHQQFTKLFNHTRRLAAELADAKARGLDPDQASSIERLFSEHVLNPAEGLHLDKFIPDQKKRDHFSKNFNLLYQAMVQTSSTLKSFNLTVTSTQSRINRQAQEYLQEFGTSKGLFAPKALGKDLEVISSHHTSGKMSRILIRLDPKEDPRWYDVSDTDKKDMVTFSPVNKSDKGVLTAQISKDGNDFPIGIKTPEHEQ